MKASKHFATAHGQSHLPSNMKHITAQPFTINTPEGTPEVVLELERRTGVSPMYLRIRMSVDEARSLSERLLLAATTAPAPSPVDVLRAALKPEAQ